MRVGAVLWPSDRGHGGPEAAAHAWGRRAWERNWDLSAQHFRVAGVFGVLREPLKVAEVKTTILYAVL